MDRLLYLVSLVVLQAALIRDVVPVIAEFVRAAAALGRAPDAATMTLRFAVAAIAIAGAAPVLGAPSIALLRHVQRGGLRFLGLPRWCRHIATGSALLYLAVSAAERFPLVAALGIEGFAAMTGIADGSARHAAVALMCGGALAAELLRRSVAPARRLSELMPIRHVQVQVIHPDALRRRSATG